MKDIKRRKSEYNSDPKSDDYPLEKTHFHNDSCKIRSMIVHTFQKHGIVQDAIRQHGRYVALRSRSDYILVDREDSSTMFADAYDHMSHWMDDSGVPRPTPGNGSRHDHHENNDGIVPIWAYVTWPDDEYTSRALLKPRNWFHALRWKISSIEDRAAYKITDWSPRHLKDLYEFSEWIHGLDLITLSIPDDKILLSDFDKWGNVLNKWPILDNDHDYDHVDDMSSEDITATFKRCVIGRGDRVDADHLDGYVQGTIWEIHPEDIVNIQLIS